MTRTRSVTWSPPGEFEEYRIVRELGAGAMGKVFLAHDTILDRSVALKFLGSRDLGGLARDRFLIEARALARLQHPNVVAVYRVGELGRRPYLVSEFVHGTSLDKVTKPLPWEEVLEVAIALARGLSAAHRRGVLHRDIKPANTIRTDTNEIKLLDFGLAKFTDATTPVTGTPRAPTPPPVRISEPHLGLDATQVPQQPAASPPPEKIIIDSNATQQLAPDAVPVVSSEIVQSSNSHSSPSLTRDGALMGTPYYMAPEIWRGEPATERSDLYSLGALLYELLVGQPPFRSSNGLADLAVMVQEAPLPPLPESVPSVLAGIIRQCLAKDPSARFASADALRAELEAFRTPRAPAAAVPEGNPYRGLHAFEAAQQTLFHGRDSDVRAIVERLRTDHFVVIAGDSGVGKSSLCHAGVGPAVESGALGDRRKWQVVAMHPGHRPILSVVTALASALKLDATALEQALVTRDASKLGEQRRLAMRALGNDQGVLLIVDHLEELVTVSTESEAAAAAEFLAELIATGTPGLAVLGALRGDYLTRTANLPALGDQITRSLYMLRPLTPEGIREAIVQPARAKGGRFEPETLVDELVAAAQTRGGLPLVQFALAELWEARDADNVISGETLRSLGGVAGALTRHADSVIDGLRDDKRKAAVRVLLALIAADGTRVQRTREELIGDDPTAATALEALLKGRLVSLREDEGGTTYEIAHDALIQQWNRLRGWLDDDGERRIVRRRIAAAADEWQRLKRTPELLWHERQLLENDRVPHESLDEIAQAFLLASRASVRRRRIRKLAIAIGIPLAVAAIIVFVRMRIQMLADERLAAENRERDRRVAVHVDLAAKALDGVDARVTKLHNQQQAAFARFDARDFPQGEQAWSTTLAAARVLDGDYSHASQELEHALVIDPTREDVKNKLAHILHERAQLADDFHNSERREELLRRLGLYDTTGMYVRKWSAQATLDVNISTRGATVSLAQIERDGARRVERASRPIGTQEMIAPGDYVVIASAPGHADVRYPLHARPGEHLTVAFALPKSAQVPAGFVYIQAGRFLVGTADEGARTSFLTTVPIHEAKTASYLMAKHETTFGEWIAFLDALPDAEREKYRPGAGAQDVSGQVNLEKRNGRWTLKLMPTKHLYTASQGEPLRYLDRTKRAAQDWTRMPVLGVSLEDIRAYTRWLDATGRVPHARPCTELEWERAARGADDREFPHGDSMAPDDADFDETYGKQARAMGPDEVGSHPASRSPFGIDDLVGNAFEWVAEPMSPDAAAMRGGAFYFGALTARVTNRNTLEPTARSVQVGVRVCASAPE